MPEIQLQGDVTLTANDTLGGIWVRTPDKSSGDNAHVFITASELQRFALFHQSIVF